MDNQTEKLNERLDFYMKAYDETSKTLMSASSEKTKVEKEIDTESQTILNETMPNPLENNQLDSLEKEYQMNIDDLVTKHEEIKNNYIKEIEQLKSDARYKEYLNLIINDDLKLVSEMEKDEVFNYLLEQNFGTVEFNNEPFIAILGIKYQPRFWKFNKIANKKANEFGMASFDEMYKLWRELRINYKSLIGNKKIANVIEEGETIEKRIESLENAIVNYISSRRDDIIKSIIIRIKISGLPQSLQSKFENIGPLLEKFNELSEQVTNLESRKTVIMDNISAVEKMVGLAEEGKLVLEEISMQSFFNNTNPEIPIFEMISDEEWKSIKQALDDKGVKTQTQEKYSVVRRKVSQKEKADLLEKYNVKEGEIFIDPNLVNKH